MFRALKGFVIQIGLAGDTSMQIKYARTILPDEPSWLRKRPKHRCYNNTFRYRIGYLGYAGAGKNIRGTHLILVLEKNKGIGDGSSLALGPSYRGGVISHSFFIVIRRTLLKEK